MDTAFRRSHDLIYLLDIIDQPEVFAKEDYDRIARLQDYAVEIRYPNDTILLDDEEVKDALSIADNLFIKIGTLLR